MANVQAGTRIGPYRVDSVLPGNRGGFAQVVAATRVAANGEPCAVALKLARGDVPNGMDPESYGQALSNEVDTLRMLKHPGIVRIYPIPLVEGRASYRARAEGLPGAPWYFVMEYLAGGSVEELVQRQGALDLPLAAEIAHQVGAALDYIHSNGYYHLDIKTNNIMFRYQMTSDRRPEAVLIDFGAAQKALRRAEVEAGALMYLPPERVQVLVGQSPPETVVNKAAADVYALGITLYRMITGDLPFRGQRDHVTTAILTRAPTRPIQFNRELVGVPDVDALIMQMLEKDPNRRPGIKEVMTRLDQAVPPPRFNGVHTPPPVVKAGGGGWKTAAFAFGAFALLEGAALGYIITKQPDAMPPAPIQTQVISTTLEAPAQVTAAPAQSTPKKPAATRTRTRTPSPEPPATTVAPPTDAPVYSSEEPTLVPTYTPAPTRAPTRPRPTATPVPPQTPGTTP